MLQKDKILTKSRYQTTAEALIVFIKKLIVPLTAAALSAAAVFSMHNPEKIDSLFNIFQLSSIYEQSKDSELAIYSPDIGTGGCTLIVCEDKTVLIDCGHEKAQTNVLDILEILGITKIDLSVLTHPDSDHIGNFSDVAGKIEIDRFVTCEYSGTSDSELYAELIGTLSKYGISPEYAHTGDRFELGDLTLDVLSPSEIYKKSNDNSVVMKLTYGSFTALTTGDISTKTEKDILAENFDLSADVLYVSHHGSRYGTSEDFLNEVQPEYAVISVAENDYNPSGFTIKRLNDIGCKIFRTDISGTICICSDGTKDGTKVLTDK